MKKSKILVLTVAPLLLLFLIGCPDHDPKITEKSYTFTKTVRSKKQEFFLGERIGIELLVENKTDYDVKSLKILKETNPKGYRAIGSDFIESGEIYRRNGKVLTYEVVATSPGKIVISPSKIKEVVVKWPAGKVIAPEDIGFSNSIKIKVKPLRLKIHQTVMKTKVRVGSKIRIDLLVENDNDLDIEDMEILFGGDTSGLRLLSPERISLRRWEHKKIRLVFLALQAGEIELRQASIKQLKFNNAWTCSEKNYGVSNPAPRISVISVRLPGREFPIKHYTNEVKNFFNLLILKILGITISILMIIILFKKAIFSRFVENLAGRISLVFLMVAVAEILVILLVCGCTWFWRVSFPDLYSIGIILTCTSGLSLLFGIYPFKRPFLSLISGVTIACVSYLTYVGFCSYALNEFMGVPVRGGVFFYLVCSIGLNGFFLRKELKRR